MLPMIERGVAALDTIIAEARRWSTPSGQTVRAGVSPLIDASLVARTYSAVRELPSDDGPWQLVLRDRKSTRLNSSHVASSYAVFCLKKKTYKNKPCLQLRKLYQQKS